MSETEVPPGRKASVNRYRGQIAGRTAICHYWAPKTCNTLRTCLSGAVKGNCGLAIANLFERGGIPSTPIASLPLGRGSQAVCVGPLSSAGRGAAVSPCPGASTQIRRTANDQSRSPGLSTSVTLEDAFWLGIHIHRVKAKSCQSAKSLRPSTRNASTPTCPRRSLVRSDTTAGLAAAAVMMRMARSMARLRRPRTPVDGFRPNFVLIVLGVIYFVVLYQVANEVMGQRAEDGK